MRIMGFGWFVIWWSDAWGWFFSPERGLSEAPSEFMG